MASRQGIRAGLSAAATLRHLAATTAAETGAGGGRTIARNAMDVGMNGGSRRETGRRMFGAGAGKGETFEGVTIHEPEPWQQNLANAVMAGMWYETCRPSTTS